tara:strand:+ start:263 stop:427 length:165 start_codon:yes stop_codon:yes gene_type:complete
MDNLTTPTFLKMCIILSASLQQGCYPFGIVARAGEAFDTIAGELYFISYEDYDR